MIYHRFLDIIGLIKIDYILFFNSDYVEIDCWSWTNNFPGSKPLYNKVYAFNIINNEIDWTDINKEIVSEKCQEHCDKIQKLRAFI